MTKEKWNEKALAFSCLSAIFFMSFDLASGFSFYLSELSVIFTGVFFVITWFHRFWNKPIYGAEYLLLWKKTGSTVIFAAAAYVFVDLINFAFGKNQELAFQKYKLILPATLLFFTLLLLRERGKMAWYAGWAIAWSGVFSVLITVFNYFVVPIYPIYYTARFSLRSDYNMYATCILTAMVLGMFLSFGHAKSYWSHIALSAGFLAVCLPAILMSGSRRTSLALCAILPASSIAFWLRESRRFGRKKAAHSILVMASTAAAAVFLFSLGFKQSVGKIVPGDGITGLTDMSEVADISQTTASQRYQTILDGSLFSKRAVIWSISWREYLSYSAVQKLVGKGGGYNIKLYDTIGEELDRIYPDREKRIGTLSSHNMMLADLLDGGFVKFLFQLWMLFSVSVACLRFLGRQPYWGLPIGMLLTFCVLGSMVSNRFGILYDRYFYLLVALLLIGLQWKGEGFSWNTARLQ